MRIVTLALCLSLSISVVKAMNKGPGETASGFAGVCVDEAQMERRFRHARVDEAAVAPLNEDDIKRLRRAKLKNTRKQQEREADQQRELQGFLSRNTYVTRQVNKQKKKKKKSRTPEQKMFATLKKMLELGQHDLLQKAMECSSVTDDIKNKFEQHKVMLEGKQKEQAKKDQERRQHFENFQATKQQKQREELLRKERSRNERLQRLNRATPSRPTMVNRESNKVRGMAKPKLVHHPKEAFKVMGIYHDGSDSDSNESDSYSSSSSDESSTEEVNEMN